MKSKCTWSMGSNSCMWSQAKPFMGPSRHRFSQKHSHRSFEVDPYNWWVANKIISCKICTLSWLVVDIKISNVDKNFGTRVVLDLLSDEIWEARSITPTDETIFGLSVPTNQYQSNCKCTFAVCDMIYFHRIQIHDSVL